jgi:SAM-dependent methyltransferase
MGTFPTERHGEVRFTPEDYFDAVADVYDQVVQPMIDSTADTVDFLAELAGRGRALELGVGTGRIAIPLAARGVRVHGVDASARMLDRLRDKDDSGAVTTSHGDFGVLSGVDGVFELVYVVFNTLYGLETQDRQVECIAAAAARLRPGGAFVVEAFVPDRARFDRRNAAGEHAGERLEVRRHDPVGQLIVARQVVRTSFGTRMLPVRMRYIWPSELDLMARVAGLSPAGRFAGWRGEPFGPDSSNHVSVYRKPLDSGT